MPVNYRRACDEGILSSQQILRKGGKVLCTHIPTAAASRPCGQPSSGKKGLPEGCPQAAGCGYVGGVTRVTDTTRM